MTKPNLDLVAKVNLAMSFCADGRLTDAYCRVIVVALLRFHNTDTGQCNPAYPKLAAASAVSLSTAKRAMKKAKELGLLDFDESDGGRSVSNRYRFIETVSVLHPFDAETVSAATINGVSDDRKRCQRDTRIERSKEHSKKHSKGAPNRASGRNVRGTRLDPNWQPPAEAFEYALTQLGMDRTAVRYEAENFMSWWIAKGGTMANWNMAFRNWLIKSKKYERQPKAHGRGSVADGVRSLLDDLDADDKSRH
ncbi:MAG: DnaT-like ssDNA-binding domain-containing protein [Methyloceanibacter sp.]